MEKIVGLSISGGATKIAGLYGAVEVLLHNYSIRPRYISGISAGAILALPLALGKFDTIREQVTSIRLTDFFSQSPVTEKGRISLRAIWNVVRGRNYLGRMDNLYETLRRNVSRVDFHAYRKDKTLPDVFVMAVDLKTGKRHFKNLKDCSYDAMLDWVVASSSIPGYVNPVEIRGMMMYDGGLRDHSIGHHLMSMFDMHEHYSIFSRPEDVYQDFGQADATYDDVLQVHMRTLDILLAEVSSNDQHLENVISQKKGIRNTQIFMPRIMRSQYDVDVERLGQLYRAGRHSADEAMKKKLANK